MFDDALSAAMSQKSYSVDNFVARQLFGIQATKLEESIDVVHQFLDVLKQNARYILGRRLGRRVGVIRNALLTCHAKRRAGIQKVVEGWEAIDKKATAEKKVFCPSLAPFVCALAEYRMRGNRPRPQFNFTQYVAKSTISHQVEGGCGF